MKIAFADFRSRSKPINPKNDNPNSPAATIVGAGCVARLAVVTALFVVTATVAVTVCCDVELEDPIWPGVIVQAMPIAPGASFVDVIPVPAT